VAKCYDLTVAKLTSPNRERKIAQPRQVAMYLCRVLAGENEQDPPVPGGPGMAPAALVTLEGASERDPSVRAWDRSGA